jgi:hypothetical protein
MLTIPNLKIPSEDEYSIARLMSAESVLKIKAIQTQLTQLFGDAIWLCPTITLHSTLMEIICDTQYKSLTRKQHFERWYSQYNQIAREILTNLHPFDMSFTELHISQAAIIIKSSEPRPFNDIRAKLLANTTLPDGTKMPPDITHCTIARFNMAIDLETARKMARHISVGLTERIDSFKLLNDLGPPKFKPMTIDTYMLKG